MSYTIIKKVQSMYIWFFNYIFKLSEASAFSPSIDQGEGGES